MLISDIDQYPINWSLTNKLGTTIHCHTTKHNVVAVCMGCGALRPMKLGQLKYILIKTGRYICFPCVQKDPKYRAKVARSIRITCNSAGFRKYLSDKMRIINARPGRREELAITSRKSWLDPVVRAKRTAAARESWNIPGRRERQIEALKVSCNRPEFKAKMRRIGREVSLRPESQARYKLLYKSPEQRAEYSKRSARGVLSGKIRPHSNHKHGYHSSAKAGMVYFRSSYEEAYFKGLDGDPQVMAYSPEPFAIEYKFRGMSCQYIPDVLVTYSDNTQILVEIKPSARTGDSRILAKALAAILYCRTNHMIYKIMTENDIDFGRETT